MLDDAIDEGEETLTLRLSNPQGARIADGEATGTIINSDSMPKAWTARFGRSVAVHVVDAVEQRLEQAPSESWAQLGGHQLGVGPAVMETVRRLTPDRDLWAEPDTVDTAGPNMTPRQLLLGSAFHLVSNGEDQAEGPRLSVWGTGGQQRIRRPGRQAIARWHGDDRHFGGRRHLEALAHRPAAGLQRGRRLVLRCRHARRRRHQFADQCASLCRLHPQRPGAAVGHGGLRQRCLAAGA